MKKERTISVPTSKSPLAVVAGSMATLGLTAGLMLSPAFMAVTCTTVFAKADLDRSYALESVGFLPSWDNVDGLFSDYVANAYKDYFSKQTRFVVQDLSKEATLLTHSKLSYQKLLEDKDVLGQLARTSRSQTLIRTRILKEGPQYRFAIEWLHAPKMEPMAVETLVLKQPDDGQALGTNDVQAQIEAALDHLISKIPFMGNVTGRDGSSVTLNIGSKAGLKRGDTVVVSTLDDVKVHPLLGVVVDWRLTKTGKLDVDSVDEGIGFCHIEEEEPGREITRYQKVTQIIPAVEAATTNESDAEERKRLAQEMPKLGYFSGALYPGAFSRDFNATSDAASRTGGGISFGAGIDAQVWLTREFFGEMGYSYDFYHLGQTPTGSSSTTLSSGASLGLFNLAAGYSYLVNGDFFGPKGWIKLGYRSASYSLPSDSGESIGPIDFHSLYLGLGGDLPIRDGWGATLNFDLGVINSATENGGFNNGSVSSSSDVDFMIGAYYRYSNRITFRGTLDVHDNGADFGNGNSLSQKIISISPAVLYYF